MRDKFSGISGEKILIQTSLIMFYWRMMDQAVSLHELIALFLLKFKVNCRFRKHFFLIYILDIIGKMSRGKKYKRVIMGKGRRVWCGECRRGH